ncbi:MAG TPA: hypothetical protein PLM75_08155, partial [bacterium]|nr:hypothetical protein [bacterium]
TIPMANSFADIAGIYVDNNYIYILERANNPEAVRIDLQTNQIVKRWQYANGNFSQNGCYDFENNVLWMSVLGAQPRIYKYTGYSEVSPTYSVIYYTAGILYSSKFFVANSADFTSVSFDSELLSQTNIYLQLRTANSAVEIETEQWRGANGINTFFTGIYTPLLNDYYSNKKYIQYRAILLTADTAITPKLKSVSINYLPKDAEKYTIRITNDGGALKNFNEPIYIAIIDTATNSVVSNYTGIVNITLDGNVNDAVWSLANGNGSLDTSIPGVARYTFSPLDNGVFTLYLKYNNIGTIRFSANSITPQGRYIIEEDSAPLVVSDYIYYEIETFSPYIKNTNFQMRITAKNSFGIDTTYNNTALLNVVLGAGVIAPLSVSINNGSSGIFNAMYNYSDTMRIFAYQINDSSVFGYSDTLYFLNKIANIVLNVETQSYYIAGRDYTATITIYDDSGNIVTNYSGSVILKQSEILYLMPASKYKEIQRAGLETSGDIVISNFINGVAQFGFHYDDAGTIAFRVVDDSAGINSNYSHNLQFTPAYFDITISNIKDTAGIDFDFNVIAKSLNNETMPNYNSILTFSPIFINPDITNAVDTNGLKITNAVITNGSLNVSQRYKESGSIRIKVSDNNYCADTVISSVSDILTFYPEKFQVLIQYPSGRSFFYLTEPWYNVNIFSISYDSEVTNNYNREIEFNKTSLKYPFNLPNNYTFSPQIDNGVLQYSNYLISLDTGINTISLYDKQRSNIKGSATANVQYAKIKIFDAAARAGAAANVRCAVLNEYNNIITADNSTRFKIAIVQPSSATSIAQTHFQNIINGEAYFTVFDNISEKVRVIPLPEYGVPQDTEAGIITFTDLKLKVKDAWLTVNDTAIPQTQLVRIELLNDFYRQEKWLDTAPLYYSIDTSTLSDSIIIINPDIFAISKDNSYDTFYIKVLPRVNYPLTLNLMPISAQATPLSGKIEFLLSKKNIRILQYKK